MKKSLIYKKKNDIFFTVKKITTLEEWKDSDDEEVTKLHNEEINKSTKNSTSVDKDTSTQPDPLEWYRQKYGKDFDINRVPKYIREGGTYRGGGYKGRNYDPNYYKRKYNTTNSNTSGGQRFSWEGDEGTDFDEMNAIDPNYKLPSTTMNGRGRGRGRRGRGRGRGRRGRGGRGGRRGRGGNGGRGGHGRGGYGGGGQMGGFGGYPPMMNPMIPPQQQNQQYLQAQLMMRQMMANSMMTNPYVNTPMLQNINQSMNTWNQSRNTMPPPRTQPPLQQQQQQPPPRQVHPQHPMRAPPMQQSRGFNQLSIFFFSKIRNNIFFCVCFRYPQNHTRRVPQQPRGFTVPTSSPPQNQFSQQPMQNLVRQMNSLNLAPNSNPTTNTTTTTNSQQILRNPMSLQRPM